MVAPSTAAGAAHGQLSIALPMTIYHSWQEIAPWAREWDELLQCAQRPTIFLSRAWLQSWWEAYGEGAELWIVAAREADGRLAGIAPLYRRRTLPWLWSARLVGDGTGDSDNLDFLIRRDKEADILAAFSGFLQANSAPWGLVEFNSLPAESETAARFARAAAPAGFRVQQETIPHLVVPLPASWEEFFARLSPKMRDAVGWRRRYLEKNFQVRVRKCSSSDELPDYLEHLFRLHRLRWQARGEQGVFTPMRRDFYGRMAQRFLDNRWLDFWLLDLNGSPVAAQFGFRYAGVHSYLQSGFDPAFEKFSPGWVLAESILRSLISEGVREYDFLASEEDYKLRWGAERREFVHLRCVRKGGVAALADAARGPGQKLINGARRAAPRPIWNVLRACYHAACRRSRKW